MKTQNNNIMLLLLLIFGCSVTFAQNEHLSSNEEVQAKIKIVKEDKFLNIYPTAVNTTNIFQDRLHYSFLCLKTTTKGNLSKNIQSGYFSLQPDETKILSFQKNFQDPEACVKMYLFIKRDSILISKDSVIINDLENKNHPNKNSDADIEFSGLIIDNIITKTGRDFCDKLRSIYILNGVNFPMIIIVEEKPFLGGRISEIKILVADNVIFQFNSQPDDDFLEMAAQHAYRRLTQYHNDRKLLMLQERKY